MNGICGVTQDFVLDVTKKSPHETRVLVEESVDGSGPTACAILAYPKLVGSPFNASPASKEIVFVLDNSGR